VSFLSVQTRQVLLRIKGAHTSFQAKTGKTPEQFKEIAKAKSLLEPGVKPTQIVNWLKDFDLEHGHAMAIVQTF
jgi:hypothetical protein